MLVAARDGGRASRRWRASRPSRASTARRAGRGRGDLGASLGPRAPRPSGARSTRRASRGRRWPRTPPRRRARLLWARSSTSAPCSPSATAGRAADELLQRVAALRPRRHAAARLGDAARLRSGPRARPGRRCAIARYVRADGAAPAEATRAPSARAAGRRRARAGLVPAHPRAPRAGLRCAIRWSPGAGPATRVVDRPAGSGPGAAGLRYIPPGPLPLRQRGRRGGAARLLRHRADPRASDRRLPHRHPRGDLRRLDRLRGPAIARPSASSGRCASRPTCRARAACASIAAPTASGACTTSRRVTTTRHAGRAPPLPGAQAPRGTGLGPAAGHRP